VDSQPGAGSVFRVYLPRLAERTEQAGAAPAEEAAAAAAVVRKPFTVAELLGAVRAALDAPRAR
jgi:CheY-like chemotaxis protein